MIFYTLLNIIVFSRSVFTKERCYSYIFDYDTVFHSGELPSRINARCSEVCDLYSKSLLESQFDDSNKTSLSNALGDDVASAEHVISSDDMLYLKLNDLCFCASKNVSVEEFEPRTCSQSSCDSTSDSCLYEGFSYQQDSLQVGIFYHGDNTVDVPNTFSIYDIENVMYIEWNFGDGYKITTGNTTVNHTYAHPGEFMCTVIIKLLSGTTIVEKKFISVSKLPETSSLVLNGPPAFVANSTDSIEYDIDILEGSDTTFTVEEHYNNSISGKTLIRQNTLSSDVSVLVFGSDYYNTSLYTPLQTSNMVVFTAENIFTESGIVTAIEIHPLTIGIVTLYHMTPVCEEGVYCMCDVSVPLRGEHRYNREIHVADTQKFNVTGTIMEKVMKTGLQKWDVKNKGLKVCKGDAIAVLECVQRDCAKLSTKSAYNVKELYMMTTLMENDYVGPFTDRASNKTPFIRVFLSKGFKHHLPQMREDVGYLDIIFNIREPVKLITSWRIYVQEELRSMNLKLNEHIFPTENISVTVDIITKPKLSGVVYDVRILEHPMLTNNTPTTELFFRYLEPGVYVVHVTASNLVSTVTATVSMYVVIRIDNLAIHKILKNGYHISTLETRVFNGTYVNVTADFGDTHTMLKTIRDTTGDNGMVSFNHRYSKGGYYLIQVEATNGLSTHRRNTTVFISHAISDIFVESKPFNSSTMSYLEDLELHIIINNGSNVIYNVYWGDGFEDPINHKHLNFPEKIILKHRYKDIGLYTVYVEAWNDVTSPRSSKQLFINVVKCAEPPIFKFEYGTIDNRVVFSRGMRREFVGEWTYESQKCENMTKHAVSFKGCKLQNEATGEVMNIKDEILENSVTCITEKFQLSVGSYKMSVNIVYKESSTVHFGFLNVTGLESPVVIIRNGAFQSIPQLQKLGTDKEIGFYNFTLYGSDSYQPEDKSNNSRLTFIWSCQLTNPSKRLKGKMCYTRGNSYWYPLKVDNKCIREAPSSILKINTSCFIVRELYILRLQVVNGESRGVTTQQLIVEEGEFPHVDFKCITNCQTKINPMERIIMRYHCPNCYGRKLYASWEIKNNSTQQLLPYNATYVDLDIEENTLDQTSLYNATLTLKFQKFSNISKKIVLILMTSSKPYDGTCNVEPRGGESMKTKFRVSCDKWRDEDTPLSYEFNYYTDDKQLAEKTLPLISPQDIYQNSISNIVFPVGMQKHNFEVKLVLKIVNKFGVYTTWTNSSVISTLPVFQSLGSMNEYRPTISNDTKAVTGYITSAIAVIENYKLNSSFPTMEPLIKENLFGGVPVNVRYKEEEKKKREEEKKETMKLKEEMIGLLESCKMDNIQQVMSVSSAMVDLTSDSSEMTSKSANSAMNMISKITNSLNNISPATEIGAVYFENFSETFFILISNTFEILGLDMRQNQGRPDGQDGPDRRVDKFNVIQSEKILKRKDGFHMAGKTAINTYQVYEHMDKLIDRIQSTRIAKSGSFFAKTPMFQVHLYKLKNDISTRTTLHNNMTIDLSKLQNIAELVNHTNIEISLIEFNRNIFSWSNNSRQIKSGVPALSVKLGEHGIPVTEEVVPITVNIDSKPDQMTTHNVSFYMPGDLTFRSLTISDDCKMMLHFDFLNDFDNVSELVVYLKFDKAGSSVDYDVVIKMSHQYGMIFNVYHESNQTFDANHRANASQHPNKKRARYETLSTGLNKNSTHKRNIIVRKLNSSTFILWNSNSKNITPKQDEKIYFTLSYQGPMPKRRMRSNYYTHDLIEERGSFDYTYISYCINCTYWNRNLETWLTEGCAVDPDKSSFYMTSCRCDKVTPTMAFNTTRMSRSVDKLSKQQSWNLVSFGGFFIEPNPLPTLSFTLLAEGYLLLIVVVTVLLIYVVGLIAARRADVNDLNKVGACFLMDNNQGDGYLFQITVNTGSQRGAGTDSNVFLSVLGDIADSGFHRLYDPRRKTFQRNNSDVFVMATTKSIGSIKCIRIWHDNSGGDWYLRTIEIVDLQSKEETTFIATRWLSLDQGKKSNHLIPASGADELTNFNYLFLNNTHNEIVDEHIWFSIYSRPPYSTFTRCQRLSVALSLLFCTMLASCMYFGTTSYVNQVENNVLGFRLEWKHLYIAMITLLITSPVNILLIGLFRLIQPATNDVECKETTSVDYSMTELTTLTATSGWNTTLSGCNAASSGCNATSSDCDAMSSGCNSMPSGWKATSSEWSDLESGIGKKNKISTTKKRIHVPHWFLYPVWMLCIAVILSTAFLVVWYGMSFGNRKSLDWLASLSIALVQDFFVVQPIKIMIYALFFSLVKKKVQKEEDKKYRLHAATKEMIKNKSWLQNFTGANTNSPSGKEKVNEGLDQMTIEKMRRLQWKERKTAAVSREITFHCLFTLTLIVITSDMTGKQANSQVKDIKELLRLSLRDPGFNYTAHSVFERLQSHQDFWKWTNAFLLNELFPEPWYSNLSEKLQDKSNKNFPEDLFLNDLNSKIVNGVRLRQIRVRGETCQGSFAVQVSKQECIGAYHTDVEETRSFQYNWSIPTNYLDPLDPQNVPWMYQGSSALDGYPIWAELDVYSGAGYVVDLFPKFNNKKILGQLNEQQWIDRHTRAVVVEFVVYNAHTNYFTMVAIVFEFPPSGGIIHYSSVVTFRLSLFTKDSAFIVIASYLFYLFLLLIYMVRECRALYRKGRKYFNNIWGWVAMIKVVLTLFAFGIYVYLDHLRNVLLQRLPERVPNVFINFQRAIIWYRNLVHIVAFVCFVMILRFIKILRFNKRISMMSSTLKTARKPLISFAVMFVVLLLGIICLANIIFGHSMYGYRNLWGSFSSVFCLLLGKFSYQQFASTNWFLGPIFFFSFNIMINWIVINMFISILDDAFSVVRQRIAKKANKYELLDYIGKQLRTWLGFTYYKSENDIITDSSDLMLSQIQYLNECFKIQKNCLRFDDEEDIDEEAIEEVIMLVLINSPNRPGTTNIIECVT